MIRPDVVVLGRFPPPLDGQAVATERLGSLLEADLAVHCVRTSAPEGEHAVAATRLRLDRVRHYLGVRGTVRRELAETQGAPILWPAISPSPLGHWRDILTLVPAFGADRSVYAIVHRGDFDRLFRSPLTARTGRRLLRRLTGVVFLSTGLADRCARWVPDSKRLVIPNTIGDDVACTPADVEAHQAAALTRRRMGAPIQVLYLSNMIESKGYRDVLEAVRLLRERGVGVHATFAGRWETDVARAAFERFTDAHGLSGHVTHLGGIPDRRRVKELYLEADVFVLPTYYPTEAQPLTVLEALNAGTPIVATAHAAIPEMITDGVEGRLVAPRAPAGVAAAIETLGNTEAWLAASRAARARYTSVFSPAAVRERWVSLLAADRHQT